MRDGDCGNEDGGAGERRREGGGASSKLRSRSPFLGDLGRENGILETAEVFERVGCGNARACI